jgi:formylglycine-generating enzyme required for sulfatase activity
VGAPGNVGYDRDDPTGRVTGRGSVGYEYSIGKFEVTTGQWLEFINAAMARPDPVPFVGIEPLYWGARPDPNYSGPGHRFVLQNVPNAAMLPASGISWRTSAVFCNWLTNNKATTQSAFRSGAYDVSTFGFLPDPPARFTDQAAHSPGATYWIPTLDEWLKASFYDPNKNGPGSGGWWLRPNGQDAPLVYGPPPTFGGSPLNQANAGFTLPNLAERLIPLGAFPGVVSPWGLLDVAGGTREYTESIYTVNGSTLRFTHGSTRGLGGAGGGDTPGGSLGSIYPNDVSFSYGLRIASSVPSCGPVLVLLGFGTTVFVRRPRR